MLTFYTEPMLTFYNDPSLKERLLNKTLDYRGRYEQDVYWSASSGCGCFLGVMTQGEVALQEIPGISTRPRYLNMVHFVFSELTNIDPRVARVFETLFDNQYGDDINDFATMIIEAIPVGVEIDFQDLIEKVGISSDDLVNRSLLGVRTVTSRVVDYLKGLKPPEETALEEPAEIIPSNPAGDEEISEKQLIGAHL